MELLDRYLQAVRFWLPAGQQRDISEELSEEIRSQVEDAEREQGRTLSDEELAAMLKQVGRPVLMAGRYLPQQYLIGPALFPIYELVLKIAALCYVVPWGLISIGMQLSPAYRAEHHGQWLLSSAVSLGYSLCFVAFVVAGGVTAVFAALEQAQIRTHFMESWDPRKLPAARVRNRISRVSSILALVANLVFILWWLDPRSPNLPGIDTLGLTMAGDWRYFFWGFLLLALGHIALAAATLRNHTWTRRTAVARLLMDGVQSVLFCSLCKAQPFARVSLYGWSPERTASLTHLCNVVLLGLFPYAILVGVVVLAFDGYRLFRLDAGTGPAATTLAVTP